MQKLILQSLLVAVAFTAIISMPVQASGDPEAGEVKSYTCTGCHGIPGYKNVYPTFHVPKIGGQNVAYLESALKSYRAGERDHSTMTLQSESLSDQDIADIAAYFASLGEE
jgi:cytochrome c553